METPALQLDGVRKSFGALHVARDVSLSLARGARQALIGPNGAGKTTLVHLITGLLRPSAGTIRVGGTDATGLPAERRVGLGLARTFQINSLFPSLTVAENVGLALAARAGVEIRPWGSMRRQTAVMDQTAALLGNLGLLDLAGRTIAGLAYGQRRLVEIALALALEPKVLLLDEPAAGIGTSERGLLLDVLLRLPRDLAVLVIEHDMSLVFRIADRISVLVDGAILTEGSVAEVRADPRVRDVYLGSRSHG
jgi:branched-chain amino acid transport system ATP-binding protein